jgi:hypothetical protein
MLKTLNTKFIGFQLSDEYNERDGGQSFNQRQVPEVSSQTIQQQQQGKNNNMLLRQNKLCV